MNCSSGVSLKIKRKASFASLYFEAFFKVLPYSSEFDMLAGSEILEKFIDHIERDDLVRFRWLKRIRKTGFDQALSEYRESLNILRHS